MERIDYRRIYSQKHFDIERKSVLKKTVEALKFWADYLKIYGPIRIDDHTLINEITGMEVEIDWDKEKLPRQELVDNALITATVLNKYGVEHGIVNLREERAWSRK